MARATKQQGKSEPSHSKDRFSSFSHRHGDATGKPATRDKTRGCRKTSISHETSSNFHSWQHDKRRSFAASPIDTARPRENQRRETRQVGAPKRAFRARLPSIFTLCSCKIDVFLRVFLRTWKLATSKSMFRARLPSTFSTSHKMPRLPRNLHLVATWRSPANMRFAKNTQQDTSKVLRLPRKMTTGTSKVLRLPQKLQHIFWKRRKSIAPATQNDFRHVPEHVWMSRSATPATRNEATTRLKPPKRTTSAELPIGTAIRGSRERLRTVANCCDRERNVERTHPQPPHPQSETGTLTTHSGKSDGVIASLDLLICEMLSLPRPALCDLGAPGWGEPWFPHSAVLLFYFSQILYGEDVPSRLSCCFAWQTWHFLTFHLFDDVHKISKLEEVS